MALWPFLSPNQPSRAEQLQNKDRLIPSKRLGGIFNGMADGFKQK